MADPKDNRKIRFSHLVRDVLLLPVEGGMPVHPRLGVPMFVLGDKQDTDDRVPEGQVRDEALQPRPWVDVTVADYAQFGAEQRRVIEDQISQNRIARTELAG